MDAGLSVPLDPLGGNQLNVRELLRLLQPTVPAVPDDADDAGMEEGHLPSSAAEREPDPVGRRTILDDYDYDDDFIDDAELVEEEHDAMQFVEEVDESADDDFNPEERGASESDDDPATETAPAPSMDVKAAVSATVHHGFGQFFVNQGDIPSKVKLKPVNPPSKLGNVSFKHIKFLAQPNQSPSPIAAGAGVSSSEEATKQAGTNGTNRPSTGSPDTAAVRRKSSEGIPPTVRPKALPEDILGEISKLARVCQEEFGDKKPKLSNPKVQDQLHVLFKTAIDVGVARLFSDIAKDKRIISLSDDVWLRLSRFLRTKRANLEQLGHALHWSAREKSAKGRVVKAEAVVNGIMKRQLETARVKPGDGQGGKQVEWTREVDERLYDWYRARCELQNAKNQLASRVKSVKKCIPGWVGALRGKCFTAFAATEQEIVDAFRRIEEEQLALDRKKREAERLERKRRKEEQAAVVAAKRAATAQAKSLASAAVGTSSTATPKAVVDGTEVDEAAASAVGPNVVKVVKAGTKAGIVKPGTAKVGVPNLGVAKIGIAKSGVSKPAIVKLAAMKPGVAKSGAVKPGMVKAGMAVPVVSKPAVAKPGVMKPGVTKGGVAKAGLTKNGNGKGGTVKVGVAKAGAVKMANSKGGNGKASGTGSKAVAEKTGKKGGAVAGVSATAGQKQGKLTGLMKKSVKMEGASGAAGAKKGSPKPSSRASAGNAGSSKAGGSKVSDETHGTVVAATRVAEPLPPPAALIAGAGHFAIPAQAVMPVQSMVCVPAEAAERHGVPGLAAPGPEVLPATAAAAAAAAAAATAVCEGESRGDRSGFEVIELD